MEIIVAHCENRGIGFAGEIPWSLPGDMARFRRLTVGDGNNAVIMGHNTWKSLPARYRPLPKRDNIVISSGARGSPQCGCSERVYVFSNLSDTVNHCETKKYDKVWVIGGTSIYKQFMSRPDVTTIHVTYINAASDCDVFFPDIPSAFHLAHSTETSPSMENGVEYWFKTYVRKQRSPDQI